MKLNSASHRMGTVVPKFYLVKMRYAPVWNYFGETKAFFLTFYAKK